MLAVIALAIGTSVILKISGNIKYGLITAIPMVFMTFITGYASVLNITGNYLPKGLMLLTIVSAMLLVLMVIIVVMSVKNWKIEIDTINSKTNKAV